MGKSRKAKTVALLWRFVVFFSLISYSNAFQVNIEKITRIYNAPNVDLRLDKDPRILKKELNLEQQRKHLHGNEKHKRNLFLKHSIGAKNLEYFRSRKSQIHLGPSAEQLGDFIPGQIVQPFSLLTLDAGGNPPSYLTYPGPVINHSTPILIHGFHSASGFLECLWNCTTSLEELFLIRSPRNSTDFDTHYIFLSHNDDALNDAIWMINRVLDTGNTLYKSGKYVKFNCSVSQ